MDMVESYFILLPVIIRYIIFVFSHRKQDFSFLWYTFLENTITIDQVYRFWKGPSHYRIINDIYKKQKNEKQHSKVAADDDDGGGKEMPPMIHPASEYISKTI